jgi:DNA-binding GntR family transcriptional regulator
LRIFIGCNRAFHRHLAELASNIRIRDQLGDLIDQMERAVLVSVKNVKHGNSASLVNEHCRIIDALQARQARRAEKLAEQHIGAAATRVNDAIALMVVRE